VRFVRSILIKTVSLGASCRPLSHSLTHYALSLPPLPPSLSPSPLPLYLPPPRPSMVPLYLPPSLAHSLSPPPLSLSISIVPSLPPSLPLSLSL
jgi:hypothetical protein